MKNFNPVIFSVCSLIACNDSIKYPDGGYDYPKHVADKDTNFYYYPVKDVMPKHDSLWYIGTYLLFKEYNEPNLSLKPLGYDVFRLQYSEAFGGFYIITVTKNSIIVKKNIESEEQSFDENRLSQTEQSIYNLFSSNYPFDKLNNYRLKYVDSIRAVNPELLTPKYFLYLNKKMFKPIDPKKIYTTATIKITDTDFNHIVEMINKSGYWKMPYAFPSDECCTDGYSYGLEANTEHKYNFVTAFLSMDSSKQRINFSKVCEEIIKYAKMDKEINIWTGSRLQMNTMTTEDVQLEDIKEPSTKQKITKHLPHKDSTVQVSDTTKTP